MAATLSTVIAMSRLPYLTESDLDDDQRRVWEGIVSTRPGTSLNDEGGLIGPFNSMLFNPRLGARVSALGATARFEMSLPRRLIEIAIITVGAHWRSNFEFWAHARMARDAGVDEAAIDAIRRGEVPDLDGADAAVHRYTAELLGTGRVADATYASAATLLGDVQMVELTTLIGYYCLISLTLNAFAIELPAGLDPIWPV